MLKSGQPQPIGTATKAQNVTDGIPLITIDAMAGYASGETQVMDYECERYVVPAFKEAEFLIQVKGSSMYPKYSSGDIVACKKLSIDTFFQWSKVYVLDTEQGALIKRIKRGCDDEHLMIVSENEKYEPFELHRSSIRAIALVVGVIRLE
jgi:phage repressor protein C with HTH and peptisase S24 domain